MIQPLIQLKGYLMTKATVVDVDKDSCGDLVQILRGNIPLPGGGKVIQSRDNPVGMKRNIGKPTLIDIMVDVLGVLRMVLEYREETKLSLSAQKERKLERFTQVMNACEGILREELEHKSNVDVSDVSLKYPRGEDQFGYLVGGAGLPATQCQRCPACLITSLHHPAGYEIVKKKRKQERKDWKIVLCRYAQPS